MDEDPEDDDRDDIEREVTAAIQAAVIRKAVESGWRPGQAEDCAVCGNIWLEGEPPTLACPNGHFVDLECCELEATLTPVCPICSA